MKIKEIIFVFFIAVCISQVVARSTTTTDRNGFDEIDRFGLDRQKREADDESDGNDDDDDDDDDEEEGSDENDGSDEEDGSDQEDKPKGSKKKGTKGKGKTKTKKDDKTKKPKKTPKNKSKKKCRKCPKCTSQKVVPCVYRQKAGTQPVGGGGGNTGDIFINVEVNDEDDQNDGSNDMDDTFVNVKTGSGGTKKLKYCDQIKGYKNKDLNDESDEDDQSEENEEGSDE